MMDRNYWFGERLGWSEGIGNCDDVKAILLANIPQAVEVRKASSDEDRMGTDYWIDRAGLPPLSVDVKCRSLDPVTTPGIESDDLALEVWSVVEKNVSGWTLDSTRETDYVMWFFEPTRRWVLVAFPQLCTAAVRNIDHWKLKYPLRRQCSNDGEWHSECIFVPRQEVWRSIYRIFGGIPEEAAS